jgi:predicted metal-dependent HD superfamily phosphohydrolase
MLKETFINLLSNYTDNELVINDLWNEVIKNYSSKKRHYHTLNHLENLLNQLTEIKGEIEIWNAVLFTLYYHDIIYNSLKSDNEEKSALLAEQRMKEIAVDQEVIELCKNQILATKTHVKSFYNDTNYFTDADLSVLGQPWEIYQKYYEDVRKEYAIYPNLVYNPGRKKVLIHFLSMDKIYKTDYFIDKFETQARINLQNELAIL